MDTNDIAKRVAARYLEAKPRVNVWVHRRKVWLWEHTHRAVTYKESLEYWKRLLDRRNTVVAALKRAGIKHYPLRPRLMVRDGANELQWQQIIEIQDKTSDEAVGAALSANKIPYV